MLQHRRLCYLPRNKDRKNRDQREGDRQMTVSTWTPRAVRRLAGMLMLLAGCSGGAGGSNAVLRRSDLDCMMRAMYFESNRSSRDGMAAPTAADFAAYVDSVHTEYVHFGSGWDRWMDRHLVLTCIDPLAVGVRPRERHLLVVGRRLAARTRRAARLLDQVGLRRQRRRRRLLGRLARLGGAHRLDHVVDERVQLERPPLRE